jgi:O-antigen ligase
LEFSLLTALGLAFPFANFPLAVWRGFGIDLSHVVAGLLVLVGGARVLRDRAGLRQPPGMLCVGALLASPLLAYAFWRLPGFSASEFWRSYVHLAFWLAAYAVVASCAVTEQRFSTMLGILACEGLILGVYGAWQTIAFARGWPTGVSLLNRLARERLRGAPDSGVWRATATFEEPKFLAIYLSFAAIYAYALAVRSRARGGRASVGLWLVAVLATALSVTFTASVGGIVIMAVLLPLMAVHFIGSLQSRKVPALVFGVFLAGAAGAWLWAAHGGLATLLRNRITAAIQNLPGRSDFGAPYTSGWRYERNARYAVEMFKESPLFGIGVGQFAPIGEVRGRELGFSLRDTRDPWVGWMAWIAETGVMGLAILATLLAVILRRGWRVPRPLRNPYTALTWLLVFAVVSKETHSAFYVTFWTWYPLGIAALSARVAAGWRGEETRTVNV